MAAQVRLPDQPSARPPSSPHAPSNSHLARQPHPGAIVDPRGNAARFEPIRNLLRQRPASGKAGPRESRKGYALIPAPSPRVICG